jgi:hypothetical protein
MVMTRRIRGKAYAAVVILHPVFFVPVAFMACAKPAPPAVHAAPSAPLAPSSHVSIAMEGSGIKAELVGPIFARLDPGSRQLTLFAFRADSLPTPSCDTLSAFKLTRGAGFRFFAAASTLRACD